MGFFEKLIKGLKRTKEAFSKKMYQLFAGRELNDEFYEELENTLISSDLGVEATEQILEEFKDACFKKKINFFYFVNDPSAGSPTETLLRLLLPLNDKVQWTSRDVGGGEPPPSPRSEHFTGPFNR